MFCYLILYYLVHSAFLTLNNLFAVSDMVLSYWDIQWVFLPHLFLIFSLHVNSFYLMNFQIWESQNLILLKHLLIQILTALQWPFRLLPSSQSISSGFQYKQPGVKNVLGAFQTQFWIVLPHSETNWVSSPCNCSAPSLSTKISNHWDHCNTNWNLNWFPPSGSLLFILKEAGTPFCQGDGFLYHPLTPANDIKDGNRLLCRISRVAWRTMNDNVGKEVHGQDLIFTKQNEKPVFTYMWNNGELVSSYLDVLISVFNWIFLLNL